VLVRVITGSHHRSGLDVPEPETERFVLQVDKLFRFVEASNRQVILRRPQILAHGEDVDSSPAEVAENLDQFICGFAEADHHSAFRSSVRRKLLGVFQQGERALVTGAGAHHAIESGHGLRIVIQYVGFRVEHDAQRFFYPLEIRNQHFHAAIGREFANLADGFGKDAGAADVVIIAVHTGHDGVLQA